MPTPSGNVDNFAIFDTALCPTASAITYGAMIHFLRQSHYEGSAISGPLRNIDIYSTPDGKTVAVYCNNGVSGGRVQLPDAACTLYDLFGNPKTYPADGTLSLTDEPVYAVFEKGLALSDFGG